MLLLSDSSRRHFSVPFHPASHGCSTVPPVNDSITKVLPPETLERELALLIGRYHIENGIGEGSESLLTTIRLNCSYLTDSKHNLHCVARITHHCGWLRALADVLEDVGVAVDSID